MICKYKRFRQKEKIKNYSDETFGMEEILTTKMISRIERRVKINDKWRWEESQNHRGRNSIRI